MIAQEAIVSRPRPPRALLDAMDGIFMPAPDVEGWLRATFLDDASPLYNPTHDHLNSARLGILWSNTELMIRGARRAAVAMRPTVMGSKVDKDMRDFMMRMFFRVTPHFVILFDAWLAEDASDRDFCCLSDHELMHCGQKMKWDCPDFNKDGSPKFTMRPHDRELFDGEIERWGTAAVFGDKTDMVVKAAKNPLIPDVDISRMCGTCALR